MPRELLGNPVQLHAIGRCPVAGDLRSIFRKAVGPADAPDAATNASAGSWVPTRGSSLPGGKLRAALAAMLAARARDDEESELTSDTCRFTFERLCVRGTANTQARW